MKMRSAFWVMVLLCCGCAHERRAVSAVPGSQVAALTTPTVDARVNLPYTFVRHGVEIRVYSIEFSADKLVVTAVVQETRDVEVDLDASLLIKAQTTNGEILPFASLGRDGKALPSSTIHLAPKEQAAATLSYELGTSVGKSIELHFPTGKWWSSVSDGA